MLERKSIKEFFESIPSAYEKIKKTGTSYEANAGGQAPLAEGKKRKRLVESKKLSDQILAHLLR